VLNPERTIQIGIWGAANIFWEFSHASSMTVIYMGDFMAMGTEAVIQKARAAVGNQTICVSVDIDGSDTAFSPGTGTPEVGGLEPREKLMLLRGLRDLNIAGADVVEVAPQYDPTTITSQLAAQILVEELAVMTLKP
jgi:guanidinopropionase